MSNSQLLLFLLLLMLLVLPGFPYVPEPGPVKCFVYFDGFCHPGSCPKYAVQRRHCSSKMSCCESKITHAEDCFINGGGCGARVCPRNTFRRGECNLGFPCCIYKS
ncbi:helofensin-3-like [Anolis carolinensis]|uniref:helofensin-3-like n=1 Tax=Anolis carolinensis TaxID=28377 RepID=UPI002F2B84CC